MADPAQIDLSDLPDTGTSGAGAGTDLSYLPDQQTGPRGGTHADLVTQSLQDHGASPVVQAAILGDIQQESNFHPTMAGDRGTSFGLMQVGGPMFRQFNADQAAKGISPGDPEYTYNQAPYILDRFKQQHPDRWDAMQNADSAPQALQIFRGTKDWGYGIAGKRYQYAQDYQQQLSGVPVQQQDTYTRVEKAVPVQEVEHQVARAYPVSGPRPPLPGGPDTLNAPPVPTVDLSDLPDQGEPPGVAPPFLAAPEGNFPLAKALVPPQFTNFMGPKQVAPTPTGALPEQPPPPQPSATDPAAYGLDLSPEQIAHSQEIWQKRLVNLPRVKAGDISGSGQKLSSFDAATVNMARGFASGLTSMEGLFGLIPPVGLAEMAVNAPHLIDQVHAAEQTPAWSQQRWEAGLNVITSLVGAGLLGEATIRAGAAGIPAAEAKPGMELGPPRAAAGEAGAAAGEAGAPPTDGAAPPTGEAGATAPGAAAAPPRTWANVAEELRWLAKNDPAKFKVRFAEEMAKRRNGEYEVKTDTEPAPAAAGPPPPKPTEPTAAAPEPATEEPVTPAPQAAAPAATQPGGPIIPAAITEELSARGHSPAAIAAMSAGQAANLVLQPAPDEVAQAPAAAAQTPALDLTDLPDKESPTGPAAATPAAPGPNTATLDPTHPITDVPLSQITLSKDVPQFKAGADEKGVVQPLAGKYERVGTPPVQLWQRLNGDLELISGRHRLDLAQRTGATTIPSQIHREADGFTKQQAARLDAELNIRDEQGSIADYANYFKNSGITREAAQARGLLARGKGAAGFSIAHGGSESLFALHQSGRLTDAQAQAIAEAAPGNEGLQRVGIQQALEGRSGQSIGNLIRAFKAEHGGEPELEQPELLSAGDPAMQRMAKAGDRAGKVQREIGQRIIAVEGAARHPGKAKALGVDVGDPANVVAKAKELKALQERAKHWDMDDQLRDMILKGDMTPEEVIKALSKPRPPPPDEGTGDLFNVAETPGVYAPGETYSHSYSAGDFGSERLVTVRDSKGNVIGQRDPFYPQGIPVSPKARDARVAQVAKKIVQEHKAKIVGETRAPYGLRLGQAPNSTNLHPDPQRASLKQLADDDPGVIEATKRVLDANPHTRRLRDALLDDGRVQRRGRKIFILDKGGQAVGQVDNATGGLSEFVDVPIGRFEKGETPERGMPQRQEKIEQYAGLTTRPPLVAAHGPRFPGDTYQIINGHHRYEAALIKGTPSLRTDASIVDSAGTWISVPRAGQESGIPDYAARLSNTIAAMQPPTPAPYGEGNPVPAANTVKLAEDVQTFLDFNKVPPARKPQATEEIKNTLALAGDPALQAFYQGGGFGIPGPQLAAALRANKGRVSIIYHDLISRQIPTWNIEGSIIATPADFAMAVQPIRSPYFESFKVIARDPVTKRVLATEITSVGTLDEAIVHPRDAFRLAAKYPNAEFIVSHNHPSGKPKPSDPDRRVQAKLHEAAAAVGVKLADHVITNGHEYFSFEQEEATGDGYGKLPSPVNQPWEVVRQEESPKIQNENELARFTASLRPDDPNAVHIFYTGTQGNLKALERVSQGLNLYQLKKAVAAGIAREAPFGVLVDFAKPPPPNVIRDLVFMTHDAMGVKLLDASWPGMDSARATARTQYGLRNLQEEPTVPYGGSSALQRGAGVAEPGAAARAGPGSAVSGAPQVPQLQPLSAMEQTKLQALRAQKGSLTRTGKRVLARLEARLITQGDLLAGQNDVFNLHGEEVIDWAARQRQADAAEAVRVAAQQAAEKAQMSLFEKPDMPYVTGTGGVHESNGGGYGPRGPRGASMFSGNTPPRSNPQPIWAKRYANKMRTWWQKMLPRSYEIVRKVPESPAITEHQRLLESELSFMNKFTSQPWWQTIRRRPEAELVDLEHQAVTRYRTLLGQNVPRETAWAQAVAKMPPDFQALLQHREARVPTERWAAGQLAVDEPKYTGDPYLARLTNEEGKAVVDLHPQIANWGRHIRQSIGSFDKSRVHATMKEGIQNGVQYEPPTMAAFTRELYSTRLENTARMLQRLKQEGVLFDEKADAIAASRALKKSAGPVTLVRGFGGKDYWARSRVEAQFLAQNLNTTNSAGAIGKMVRVANAFTRNPNLIFNPLPHVTKNMAFKYALARIGNYTLRKSAREFGTNAQMQARFQAVMPMPASGVRLPQLRALEAGTYLERMLAKGGKWLSGNHFSARFNFAKADPALRYALWKTYLKKGLSDQAAANHVWVDLIRYDENSGALNFWRGIPFNFFGTWRLGTYISLAKQLRSHPIRTLLFIGAVEYLREILYRKYGWWTHLPVDYVDAPLASAIQDPRTIPGVAATTLLFGPGGGQAPSTIEDVMKTLHGDPGQTARVVNMFWGLSQLYNMPHEFNAYLKDKDPKHLALILASAATATHSALKYEPHRLMQWLPEWMPGLQKSAIVRQSEALQGKIQATQEKARATFEARHGISASLEHQTEEKQMEELRRAAGVHPPKPGPPRRTRVLPSPRSSGRPRGF